MNKDIPIETMYKYLLADYRQSQQECERLRSELEHLKSESDVFRLEMEVKDLSRRLEHQKTMRKNYKERTDFQIRNMQDTILRLQTENRELKGQQSVQQ